MNLLIIISAYLASGNTEDSISDNLRYVTYGDDLLVGVKNRALQPNQFITLAASYGFKATDASKKGDMSFKDISEVTFLKRSFVKDIEHDKYLAPLNRASILKSLCYTLPSALVDREVQLSGCVYSAYYEFFMHGRAQFEKDKCKIAEFCKCYNIRDPDLMYDDILQKWLSTEVVLYDTSLRIIDA